MTLLEGGTYLIFPLVKLILGHPLPDNYCTVPKEQEKGREKEKVGGRPAKLNEKKVDRDLEREIRKTKETFVFV